MKRQLPQELPEQDSIQASFLFSHDEQNPSFSLNVDLNIPAKGLTAIFGQSGSGKTTLLRCIAGLESKVQGNMVFRGSVWQNEKKCMPTHKRPLSFVFQESSLFPHLTVEENFKYATKRSIRFFDPDFYEQIIDLLGIRHLLTKGIQTLSGGERQRVAIARAVLSRPKLLLMDEPLSSLDEFRKQEILPYLERLKTEAEVPIIYVSHSLDEVARLADHIILLDKGKVGAEGDVKTIFSRLNLPIRFGNDAGAVIEGKIESIDSEWQLATIKIASAKITVPILNESQSQAKGQTVRLRILAKDVSIAIKQNTGSSILNKLICTVDHISQSSNSPISTVRLKLGADFLLARLTRKSIHELDLKKGSKVWAQIKSIAII